jgi:quinol monooxygenase YgiN
MHIQVVNFQLSGMSDAEFRSECDGLAPVFAAVPGLISKVWLADPATGTYGGIYTWEDQAAMAQYFESDLFKAVAGHPHFAGLTSRDFSILEGPTRVTRGVATAVV